MANIAKNVIKPSVAKQFRIVFIYTGQGDSAILAVPTGESIDDYDFVLVDCDLDKEDSEVNLTDLLKDLLEGNKLPIYINTHPHKDHTGGIKEIYDKIGIKEVWHSNHNAKGKNKNSDDELKYVLKEIGKENEFYLKGSDSVNKLRDHKDNELFKNLGLIDFHIFAPAEFVCDDIEDEDEDIRYNRIHEQCGVFKFTYKGKSVLFTGDADKKAWQEHITEHHGEALKSDIVTASHHGSRTAFKTGEDDDKPFKDHLTKINANYLVISAPKQEDSPHDHPHDDAIKIYKEFFKESNIFHLAKENNGDEAYCLVVTITEEGKILIDIDKELIAKYSKTGDNDKKQEKNSNRNINIALASSAKPYAKI